MFKIDRRNGYFLIIILFSFVSYMLLYSSVDQLSSDAVSCLKSILCWLGLFTLAFVIISWKANTDKFLTLYTLFMVFFFLFNYGQCFLWAFGQHFENEIGSISLYRKVGVPTDYDIVKTQLIVLISGIMMHSGAILSHKKPIFRNETNEFFIEKSMVDRKYLYKFCGILCPLAAFSEYYYQIRNFLNAKVYGYTGLYYNTDVQSVNVIFQILARLFFPSLIGLLMGSNYENKSIRRLVYILFGIDVLLSMMVGDRGGWLYALMLLLICHTIFYKKLKIKDIFILGVSGYFGMISLIAIRNIRNHGVTIAGFLQSLSGALLDPISSTLTEMGGTMGVTTVFVMKGWNIFPYGNSFLYGLLIAPTKRIISLLHLNYESISGWFSQSYLKISNGAGFSIVAEVLANFGPYLLPIIMIIVGIIIQKITDLDSCDKDIDVMPMFYKIITTSVIINISRNCFSYNMGEIIYTTLLFYILFSIYKGLTKTGR